MNWLNYHHLLYFWVVAREGSVAKACKQLRLAQPTISGQLRVLEDSLKTLLFQRSGRNLVLTETGRTVYRYADEIFSLGRELQDTLKNIPAGRPIRFSVGVVDSLPKLIVQRILAPVIDNAGSIQIHCVDGDCDHLIAQMALHELDLVISDYPANPRLGLKAFNHPLGESGTSFFGTRELSRNYRRGFPQSLNAAPFLLPTENASLRRPLEKWFENLGIRPTIRGEFADSALIKAFGHVGTGIFVAPTVVEAEIKKMYQVDVIGRDPMLKEAFFAISVEKRLKHPAVIKVTETARTSLFGDM